MLHIFTLRVPNRPKFGGVFMDEFILPNKIGKITGICANVILDDCSRLVKNLTSGNELTLQLGTVSVSVNNTDIVNSSIRATVLAKQPISSLSKNMIKFDAYPVHGGSLIRIIHEEVIKTPFVKADNPNVGDYFQPNEKPTNGYSVKIYINYEKR